MSFKYCKVVKEEIELIFWLSPRTGKFHEMLNEVRGILIDFEKSVTVTIIFFSDGSGFYDREGGKFYYLHSINIWQGFIVACERLSCCHTDRPGLRYHIISRNV